MFIQTENTPNPSTLKFIPGRKVLELNNTANITNLEQAKNYPLALEIMSVEGIRSVFLSHDFISVTKLDTISWDIIRADIIAVIMDYYMQNKPMIIDKEVVIDRL